VSIWWVDVLIVVSVVLMCVVVRCVDVLMVLIGVDGVDG
jgi:hypothetical protein